MENNLDKLYQRKLGTEANREFSFQDNYWEEMEQLIDQDTGNQKNRLWIWLSGLAILLIGSFFLFQNLSKNESESTAIIQESTEKKRINSKSEIKEASVISNLTSSSKTPNQPLKDELNNIGSNQNELGKAELNKQEESSNQAPPKPKKNQKATVSSTNKANESTINSSESNNYIHNRNSKNISIPPKDREQEKKLRKENHFEKNTNEENNITPKSFQNNSSTNNQNLLNTISLKRLLIQTDFPLDKSLIAEPILPKKPKRFSVALAAGYQLGLSSTGIENDINGWRFGLEAGYQIRPNIWLNSGVFYRGFRNNFESSDTILQVNYSFAKTEDASYLKASSLHNLEIPLNIGYQFGRSQIRFGLAANYLIAARGNLVTNEEKLPWERTDEENADFQNLIIARQNAGENTDDLTFTKTEIGKTNWISTNGIDKLEFRLMAEYRLLVFRNLQFGIGLEMPINKINITKKSNLQLNLMASYRFK